MFLDPTGRICDASVPGRERDEPGRPDYREITCRDRVICVGNPWFIPFFRSMGREFADGDEFAMEVADRLAELMARPDKWQREFDAFLAVRKRNSTSSEDAHK